MTLSFVIRIGKQKEGRLTYFVNRGRINFAESFSPPLLWNVSLSDCKTRSGVSVCHVLRRQW